MRAGRTFLVAASCSLLLALAASSVVRGVLYRVAPNGARYPAVGVAVSLWHQQYGRSTPARTGSDGTFYLYNIPPGSFVLEVWAVAGAPPLTFPVVVPPSGVLTVPPIRVP